MSVLFSKHQSMYHSIRRFVTIITVPLLMNACASLPDNHARTPSYVDTFTAETTLGQDVISITGDKQNLSGFHDLPKGIEAYAARLRLIRTAEKTLDLQYFIWKHDLTGRGLFNQLLEAADRGVRVRLLLDDFDTAGKEDVLHIINAHSNIEIHLFNPFANRDNRMADFITDTGRVNRRMHNKSLIADNQAVIMGGRNIGDEYFDAVTDVAFADMDVLAIGPIVGEISQSFDLYWNSQWTYPLALFPVDNIIDETVIDAFRLVSDEHFNEAKESEYAKALRKTELTKTSGLSDLPFAWGKWTLLYDQPSKVEAKKVARATHLTPKLKEKLDEAQYELNIVSPYFVPGQKFTDYLIRRVQEDGIHIRVVTNSLAATDVPLVHAGYMRYRKSLLQGGVELYEYKPDKNTGKLKWSASSRAALHGKIIGFDKQYIFIGSFNMDARSVVLNTELGVYFESPEHATLLSTKLDKGVLLKCYQLQLGKKGHIEWITIDDGEKITFYKEPKTTFLQRFTTKLLSIVVPESQL